ncbi:hypothetical protein LRR18_07015 [Mangrovimonas sp. AS39]|uniref:hypothetical protein n=1 Tax=Mangrovimonas TaxID=1211036 RepID=UPI0006B5F8A5|nr:MULTISPECIES: hypothetical protein [Mangrovimonas]MCF1191335.1 hypothetical protein [Mangrovimonas futianensis]MCF1195030.1 hypothetical protein [Mangrovimonas futianensis]MCF1421292.1 hypothetical protein [Mangrovimonas futianensis]NIK92424.1 hypothetical protein [Mangrovimonas sp. CR14]
MKKLLILCISVLLVSCGSSTKIVGAWTNKDKLATRTKGSVFILAMTNNTQAKNVMEEEIAFQAGQRGIKATKSKDIFIQKFTKEDMPSKEYLLREIKATGAKTIFTVNLQDKETTTRYHPGNEMYVSGYSPYMYGYYNSFYGYYNYSFPITYTPGYYDTTKTFYLETNLYDVETEELLWSAQSKTYDPADMEDFIKSYSEAIIHQMIEDGVLKSE